MSVSAGGGPAPRRRGHEGEREKHFLGEGGGTHTGEKKPLGAASTPDGGKEGLHTPRRGSGWGGSAPPPFYYLQLKG